MRKRKSGGKISQFLALRTQLFQQLRNGEIRYTQKHRPKIFHNGNIRCECGKWWLSGANLMEGILSHYLHSRLQDPLNLPPLEKRYVRG